MEYIFSMSSRCWLIQRVYHSGGTFCSSGVLVCLAFVVVLTGGLSGLFGRCFDFTLLPFCYLSKYLQA